MTSRKIIAITGYPAAGKGFVARQMANIHGTTPFGIGGALSEQKESSHVDSTWKYAQLMRERHGGAGPVHAVLTDISQEFTEHDTIVVEGVRNVAETSLLNEVYGCPVHLVAVVCRYPTRLDRFKERGEYADRDDADEQLRKREQREKAAGLKQAVEQAPFKISNEMGTTEAEIEMRCARVLDGIFGRGFIP